MCVFVCVCVFTCVSDSTLGMRETGLWHNSVSLIPNVESDTWDVKLNLILGPDEPKFTPCGLTYNNLKRMQIFVTEMIR